MKFGDFNRFADILLASWCVQNGRGVFLQKLIWESQAYKFKSALTKSWNGQIFRDLRTFSRAGSNRYGLKISYEALQKYPPQKKACFRASNFGIPRGNSAVYFLVSLIIISPLQVDHFGRFYLREMANLRRFVKKHSVEFLGFLFARTENRTYSAHLWRENWKIRWFDPKRRGWKIAIFLWFFK